METRKTEKAAALIVAVLCIVLSFVKVDGHDVGIYAGCPYANRFLYPFFHAGLLHAALNTWAMLSAVFLYPVGWQTMLYAYLVAASFPCIGSGQPTIGLSGFVFVLFGSLSLHVARRAYYQSVMAVYLVVGMFLPRVNGLVHIYCYVAGILLSFVICKIWKRK